MDENELDVTLEEREAKPDDTTEKTDFSPLPEAAEIEKMNEKERQAIDSVAAKIDVRDSRRVLQYGAAALKRMAELSEAVLSSANSRNPGVACETLEKLKAAMKTLEVSERRRGFLGMLQGARRNAELLRGTYENVGSTFPEAAEKLNECSSDLRSNVERLSGMYDKNLDCYKLITMYLFAGKIRVARDRETTLASMRVIAQRTELPQDLGAVRDFENALQRFEKKLHDLEITRVVCMQMAPIIRLLQNSDNLFADKLQSLTSDALPLWKSRTERSLGIVRDYEAASEQGSLNTEALKNANESFIAAVNDLLAIGAEGTKSRKRALSELELIENDLKKKLLELQE